MDWINQVSSEEKDIQKELRSTEKLPQHIGIIMDGNGRWATNKTLPRVAGHREGINSVREIVKASSQTGVSFLTLYAFSTENWRRPRTEVDVLMGLLLHYLKVELDELHENNVRMLAIGNLNSLPKKVQEQLFRSIERTQHNDGLTLTLALSYSGRWDMRRAMQMIALDVRSGKLSPEDVSEDVISSYLSTDALPDPDLIIRTSGEMRLSNFLLWEAAYSEIYVTEELWPSFRREQLYEALFDYTLRERRFGKTSQQLSEDDEKEGYVTRIIQAFKSL